MSVQHESPPPTAHHSHHHTHTFPATPVGVASSFHSDVSSHSADSYEDPDHLTAHASHHPPSPAPAASMSSANTPLAASSAQPKQPQLGSSSPTHTAPSLSASNTAQALPSSADPLPSAVTFSPAVASSSSSSSSTASTSPSSTTPASSSAASHAAQSARSSAAPTSHTDSADSAHTSTSTSSPPSLSAIDRLRPSLQMYRNQVAGHSPLLWHSGTICKPLIPAEYTFYSQLEEQMAAFMPYVPKYYGLLDLEQLTEEMASSLLTESSDSSSSGTAPTGSTERQRSESGEGEKNSAGDKDNSSDETSSHSDSGRRQSADDGASNSPSAPSLTQSSPTPSERSMTANSSAGRIYNKWAVKCALRKPGTSKSRIQYIVLEDLTYAYAKPCILDLKVGTRQHSDTEPPSKIASKTARCLHTTSHSLGLRLCGMQVYHPAEDMYQVRDKYWGRGLDAEGFGRAMRDYFYDGERVVAEMVRAFIARMEKMRRAVLMWTKGRRFYSSSLLLVYEGDRSSRASGREQEAASGTGTANATGLGELARPSTLRQGSESSIASTGSGFFSPLLPPVAGATSASPSRSTRNRLSHQPLAASASMASLQTHDTAQHSTNSALSGKSVLGSSLSSSVPSLSTVPNTRSTLPASFSSATLSSTFLSAHSDTNSASSSASTHSASASSSTAASSASSHLSAPIKLYSHKRKTTHAQAMALARQRGSIDVRIIDFAHTSVVGEAAVEGGPVESGSLDEVDSGLLFGFDCLLALLRNILQEEEDGQAAESSPHPPAER